MTNPYHEGQREFQDRFDTRRLADRLATAASDTFSPELATFIEARDMFRTLGNIAVNPRVGLLFIDFESGSRLRVNGEASIDFDDPLLASYQGALCVVRVRALSVFVNCRRYVHEYSKVTPSPFVPRDAVDPPVPDWKLDAWFDGTLAADDPAHDPARPSAPAIPRF